LTLVKTPLPLMPFDGDSPEAAWLGTRHLSQSRLYLGSRWSFQPVVDWFVDDVIFDFDSYPPAV
jgi:hypothetical protein